MIAPKPDSALVVLGHGSTENEDSSTPTHRQAERIRRMGLFREVHTAFWKEEPGFRQVVNLTDAKHVYLVPHFISEGYFTREVIPRELELSARTTTQGEQQLHYCDPIGIHQSMTDLLLHHAEEALEGAPIEDSALFVVGHGTKLNANSTTAIRRQVEMIRERNVAFDEVRDAYMEEAPFISHWHRITERSQVVVVPFFIADGLHSYQDIPVLLGIEKETGLAASRREVFRCNPYKLKGRTLYYSRAIGSDDSMSGVILDQVDYFDRNYHSEDPADSPALPEA